MNAMAPAWVIRNTTSVPASFGRSSCSAVVTTPLERLLQVKPRCGSTAVTVQDAVGTFGCSNRAVVPTTRSGDDVDTAVTVGAQVGQFRISAKTSQTSAGDALMRMRVSSTGVSA